MHILTASGLPVLLALAVLFAVPVVLDTIRRRERVRREAVAAHRESIRRVTR